MECFQSALIGLIAGALKRESFQLIDVGCSGGISPAWRNFGDKLRAFAFDPNLRECERLQAKETCSGVEYLPRFVGLPPDHAFAAKLRSRDGVGRWLRAVWGRLSVARTRNIRQSALAASSARIKTELNAWQETELADPTKPIFLQDFLDARGVQDVDFVKIDVDGADFEILNSLDEMLDRNHIIGVGIEVNYPGSIDAADNAFHNVDRFMREKSFDLFDLTTRRYSSAALPSRYDMSVPAQSQSGRIIQGDALFVRDICSRNDNWAEGESAEKLAKASALFALFGLADCAAEILLTFRTRLSTLFDIDRALDLLAAEMQERHDMIPPGGRALSYREYIEAFERDDPMFYGPSTSTTSHLRAQVRQLEARLRKAEAEARYVRWRAIQEASAPGNPSPAYDLARSIFLNGATGEAREDLHLTTAVSQWAYSVEVPLRSDLPEGGAQITLEVHAHEGGIGVGVLAVDGHQFVDEAYIGTEAGVTIAHVLVHSASSPGPMIIRNISENGPSRASIKILAILPLGGSVG